MGARMAPGAERGRILRIVLSEFLVLLIGVVVGLLFHGPRQDR